MKSPLLALVLSAASLCFCAVSRSTAAEFPGKAWPVATPAEMGLDESKLAQAREYALTGEGSGCIIYHGKLVIQWGDQTALYDLKSSSKAIGVTALGLALKDGLVHLDDPAKKYHPTFGTPPDSNAQTGWLGQITLRHLATQTAGFEFFVKSDANGNATWSPNIQQRGGIFTAAGQCYRLGFTYNAGLKRYLLCMTGAGNDTRFAGGFGIYDAPEPWGPWTTAFHTDSWDTGPGESSSLPTKWMSTEGRTVHLVFSSNDSFSVRRGEIILRNPANTATH